jgi:hypothetical protein
MKAHNGYPPPSPNVPAFLTFRNILLVEIYRCVKMRLELNRSWQQQMNPYRYVRSDGYSVFQLTMT